MVLENKTQTKKLFQSARKFLENAPYSEWLVSQSFLDFLYLSQQLGRVQEVLPTLAEARRAVELSDQERLGVLRAEIRLRNFPKAEAHADTIYDITLKCHARIDLALALLYDNPGRALEHLGSIPLETFRCEGIRRVALLNSADIRPTQRHRVREVLCQLTLLACEHPDAMDSVLSRWIQSCPDRETIMAIADKMSWSTGAGPIFRQVMESRPEQSETEAEQALEEAEESAEESVETPPQDDGFRAVSLTNPSEK